jgi:hypothetical protein
VGKQISPKYLEKAVNSSTASLAEQFHRLPSTAAAGQLRAALSP